MTVTATKARAELNQLIEMVNADHTEVEITSKNGSAVLISKADFDSLNETAYLFQSPKNAEHLLSSLREAREGKIEQHDLIED